MGYRPGPRFTYELAEHGLELRVTCWACKHRVRISAADISKLLIARHRSQELYRVGDVLRCSMCGVKQPEVVPCPIADARELAEERRMSRS